MTNANKTPKEKSVIKNSTPAKKNHFSKSVVILAIAAIAIGLAGAGIGGLAMMQAQKNALLNGKLSNTQLQLHQTQMQLQLLKQQVANQNKSLLSQISSMSNLSSKLYETWQWVKWAELSLTFKNDAVAAKQFLQSALQTLKTEPVKKVYSIQQAIHTDMKKIDAAKGMNIQTTLAKLEQAQSLVNALPSQQVFKNTKAVPTSNSKWDALLAKLKGLISIQKQKQALPPTEMRAYKTLLALHLANAEALLLQQRFPEYKQQLQRALHRIAQTGNNASIYTKLQALLKQLIQANTAWLTVNLQPTLNKIQATLKAKK